MEGKNGRGLGMWLELGEAHGLNKVRLLATYVTHIKRNQSDVSILQYQQRSILRFRRSTCARGTSLASFPCRA